MKRRNRFSSIRRQKRTPSLREIDSMNKQWTSLCPPKMVRVQRKEIFSPWISHLFRETSSVLSMKDLVFFASVWYNNILSWFLLRDSLLRRFYSINFYCLRVTKVMFLGWIFGVRFLLFLNVLTERRSIESRYNKCFKCFYTFWMYILLSPEKLFLKFWFCMKWEVWKYCFEIWF